MGLETGLDCDVCQGCAEAVFAELVEECLACRAPEIVELG